MYLVSACLCGVNCKYNGGNNLNPHFRKLMLEKRLIPVCPELISGLTIPRSPSEITSGTGNDVLDSRACVISKEGIDLNQYFLEGAKKTLELARKADPELIILKSRSPSCGVGQIYDGTFSKTLCPGDGVTAALLKRHGYKVINDEEYLRTIYRTNNN
ncbi:MAG: DUF523 domain-containing protein [Syntrophomonadaceae bacterium]|nr:DUF523 domain-containing protein [Syntrophomonadaceae bacterium]MDD3022882.1 DUF523 domain-containing protein [Syntrophomonadaceae bacterium]